MAIPSPKFTLNVQDLLKGLLMAVLTPVLTILANLSAGNFHINWTEAWHMAVSAGAAYLLKNLLSGPPPPTGGGSSLNKSVKGLTVLLVLLFLSTGATAQSLFKPLPLTPKKPVTHFRAITGPTDSFPNISNGHFQGFRFSGPDVAFAVPDFSVYTGLGLDYVWASADAATGKWVYDFTVGPRIYGGANLGQPTVNAIGAIGLRFTALKGWLALGFIYNLTTKKPQATIGNPAALIPGLN